MRSPLTLLRRHGRNYYRIVRTTGFTLIDESKRVLVKFSKYLLLPGEMSRIKTDKASVNGSVKCEQSVWTRAITANSEWPDKEEFLDVIYWGRQAIGIIVGIAWGLIPLKGFPALLLFVLVNAGVTYLYLSNYQQVDEEEFGGAWELTKEGFMTSFAGFLVTWIIIYSGLHFD